MTNRLIIVGASGAIGSSLFDVAKRTGRNVVGTARSQGTEDLVSLDIRTETLGSVVELGRLDCVYLLAGYGSPSWIFEHSAEARRLNIDATKRIVDEIVLARARLVFMSTDQVFDGKTGGYRENAPPAPLNLYGRMKAEIEDYIGSRCSDYAIARTGWNVPAKRGHHCVVEQTYRALLSPGARMATDNIINVTDVMDTVKGLLALADRTGQDVFHLVSSPPVARSELARSIVGFSRFGNSMKYSETTFDRIEYTEPRPRRAYLDADRTRSTLALSFKAPEAVIADKVLILDGQAG